MKKEDNAITGAPATNNQVEAAKVAVQSAFPSGAILVSALVVQPTPPPRTGTSKNNKPYSFSTTPAVIAGRFAQLVEFSPRADAKHQQFSPGVVVVQARNVSPDPKNPAILRVSLTEGEDVI